MKNLLIFFRYKLYQAGNKFKDIFNFKSKLKNYKIVKEKRHLKFTIARGVILTLSFITLYFAITTRRLLWIILTYFLALVGGELIKEYEIGLWKNWYMIKHFGRQYKGKKN